jgi:hypothetical protein
VNILSKLNSYDTAQYKIIASDLNFGNCYCKNPILSPKPLDSSAPDLFESYGFQQLTDIPTCIRLVSVSLIDLIFVNKPDDIICHGTLPSIADHEGTLVCFNTKSKKPKQKSKIIYDYKNADVEGLIIIQYLIIQPLVKQKCIHTFYMQLLLNLSPVKLY